MRRAYVQKQKEDKAAAKAARNERKKAVEQEQLRASSTSPPDSCTPTSSPGSPTSSGGLSSVDTDASLQACVDLRQQPQTTTLKTKPDVEAGAEAITLEAACQDIRKLKAMLKETQAKLAQETKRRQMVEKELSERESQCHCGSFGSPCT